MLLCFQAPATNDEGSSRRGSQLSVDVPRTRTASTSSNASSASTASTNSSSSHENELLSAMQSQEPQVMDIAASHLPEPEPYVEPHKPPAEDTLTSHAKPQLKMPMMKFVAASKESARTSSVDDDKVADGGKAVSTEVLDSGKVAEVIGSGKVVHADVIDSGSIVESGKVGVVEEVIDSGKVMLPPPVPIVIEPPRQARPAVDDEEKLRKQRETEKVTACTLALLSSVRSSS